MDYISEKDRKNMFNKILKRPENVVCADCRSNGPSWASLKFSVLVCLQCSGEHRRLGPHVTFVRSCNLDKWEAKQVLLIEAIGNKVAN